MDAINLELMRLKMRAHITEVMLTRLYVAALRRERQLSSEAAGAAAAQALEEAGAVVETAMLSSPNWASFDDAERALFADEFRDIISSLKKLLP